MFRNYAESRGLDKPRTFTAALSDFRTASDSWFDGSIAAVDRRLASCTKLLHSAQSAAGDDPAAHLQVIAELSADRTALKELREDLVSGASARHASYAPPPAPELSPAERRWVVLESAKFYAEQDDARHDVAELGQRARHYAELATSASPRSRQISAAFEREVATIARMTPRPRTASRKRPVFTDFPDSQLFL